MNLKQIFSSTLLTLTLFTNAFGCYANELLLKELDLSNEYIRYLGTQYIYQDKVNNKTQVSFTRHSKSVLALPKKESNFNRTKAQTNSGIIINFATQSNTIELNFRALATINRGSDIAIYENDVFIKNEKFSAKQPEISLKFNSQDQDNISEYKIVLPSLANLAFESLKITENSQLLPIKSKRKAKYIAIGDSISHGVGQGSATYLTYPFQVAQALELELFNLAVGGAQVSPPTAAMLKDFDNIELITVLVGYNDWNAPNPDLNEFKSKYNQMIDTLLTQHPTSDIYCITPLFTKRTTSKNSKLPIQAYRNVIADIVKEKQKNISNRITLIEGDKITSIENLRTDNLSDPVHLGVKGAKLFSQELIKIIQ